MAAQACATIQTEIKNLVDTTKSDFKIPYVQLNKTFSNITWYLRIHFKDYRNKKILIGS